MTEFGPEIAQGSIGWPEGQKWPVWLRDDDTVQDYDPGFGSHGTSRTAFNWGWRWMKAFRLPADHWAYTAIAAGFTPWSGGDTAPADWNGCEVLFRGGAPSTVRPGETGNAKIMNGGRWSWATGTEFRPDVAKAYDIIGYHARQPEQPATDTADTVTLTRMTERDAAQWLASRGLHKAAYKDMLRALGFIRPDPTPAQRIAEQTGIDLATVERVLNARETLA